jgi:uncharacterized damage-inducible protein DinB
MLTTLRDLVQHKWYANAALLKIIRQHDTAARDEELRKTLHHILLTNRFWLLLSLGTPFNADEEVRVPNSLEELAAIYRKSYEQELEWISQLQEQDLARTVETHFLPGSSFSTTEALIQVCMHSQGHRSQCATRFRSLGGTPPVLDFILWLKGRPGPDWL